MCSAPILFMETAMSHHIHYNSAPVTDYRPVTENMAEILYAGLSESIDKLSSLMGEDIPGDIYRDLRDCVLFLQERYAAISPIA